MKSHFSKRWIYSMSIGIPLADLGILDTTTQPYKMLVDMFKGKDDTL